MRIIKKSIRVLFSIIFVITLFVGITVVRAQTPAPSSTPFPSPGASPVTANYYLKLTDIPGESTDSEHPGQIEIDSFQWGEALPNNPGGGVGKVAMQDFHFTMRYNKASPKLLVACASGEHLAEAIFVLENEAGQEYLKYTLSDVFCTEYETGGTNPEIPLEAFSLNFAKIEVEYKPQASGAPVTGGWDIKKNRKIE